MKKLTDGVLKVILENGLTALIKENHTSPVVAIFTYVKAGYFDESDDVVGISHLIEHMFFKGTERRGVGQIAIDTKKLGGYLNASTIYDHTLYYTVLPSKAFSKGLDIQSDALINSIFDPKELKKETEVVIQEAKRKLDTPTAVSKEKLFELAFQKHRMRRWRIGSEAGLRALTRDDFLTFHKNLYRPENIILVVVGDVNSKVAKREIEKYYSDFEKGRLVKRDSPAEPPQTHFKYRHLTSDIQQSYLTIGFHTPETLHPDTYALEILTFILGYGRSSRMYQKIKEQIHLVDSISVYNYTFTELGIFLIDAVAQPEKLRNAESAVFNVIAKLLDNPVTQDELVKARNLLESMYVFSMESVSGQANILASYEALGGYQLAEEYLSKLFRVGTADITRVVQKYLTLSNCSLLEYVPQNSNVEPAKTSDMEAEFKNVFSEKVTTNSAVILDGSRQIDSGFTIHTRRNIADKDVARYRLSNGITLLVKESHQIPLISTGVFVQGGRVSEDLENSGISGLTARNTLKGTRNRTAREIATEIENLGTGIHFSDASDYLSCTMNILSKHFEAGWDVLTDVVTAPTFPEQEVIKEKENTLASIKRSKDDMFAYPVQLFYSALYEGHAYGLPVLGTPETMNALSRGDLEEWHFKHFSPVNLIVVVVGDVETKKLIALVESRLNRLPKNSVAAGITPSIGKPAERKSCIETRNKEQTAMVLGFSGPKYTEEDYYPLKVLQNILSGLGGRFFEELRGHQSLAYTVSTFFVSRLYGGAFFSYIATSPEKEDAARDGLLKEFEKLIKEPISEKELRRSIQYTVGTYEIGLETYRSQMLQYAHNELLGRGFEEVEQFAKKIQKVTRTDILKAAQKYFDMECYTEGIVRGKNSESDNPRPILP